MHSSILWRISALSALLSVATFTAPAQQNPAQPSTGDPVADAARKARAEQKTAPKPKKVFTNDDIPSAAPPSAPASTDAKNKNATEARGDDKSGQKQADPADDPKTQAYWQKQAKKLRAKLAAAEQELDVLQRELNKDDLQYYPDPQKSPDAAVQPSPTSTKNDRQGGGQKGRGRIAQAAGGRPGRCRAKSWRRPGLGSLNRYPHPTIPGSGSVGHRNLRPECDREGIPFRFKVFP